MGGASAPSVRVRRSSQGSSGSWGEQAARRPPGHLNAAEETSGSIPSVRGRFFGTPHVFRAGLMTSCHRVSIGETSETLSLGGLRSHSLDVSRRARRDRLFGDDRGRQRDGRQPRVKGGSPARAACLACGGSSCPAGLEKPHSKGFVALPRLRPFGPAKAAAPAAAAADRANEGFRVFVEEPATSRRLRAKTSGTSRSLRASPRQRLFRDRVLRTRPDRPG